MSLLDVVVSLASDNDVLVTRRAAGSFDSDGIWIPGAATTFLLAAASIQPATGMQRVVGGRDLRSDEQGQTTPDVRVIYTNVALKTRTSSFEPDLVTFEGGSWVVVRVETWVINEEVTYRSLLTRETRGAS